MNFSVCFLKRSHFCSDDFFDSLSCEVLDKEEGRKTRMTANEERSLNQDTFGATALQSTYRRYNGGMHSLEITAIIYSTKT